MPTPPAAVLFDADGVLQRATIDWRGTLATFVRPDQNADDFILELMASELPSIMGKGDFADAIAEVLARWESPSPVEEVLELWRRFESVPEVIEIIQELRAGGVGCHLATNQQSFRRKIMHEERRYGDWFDQTFYSCDLGVSKPDPEYFRRILDAISQPADAVVFIDDNFDNVAGAASIGIHAEHFDLELGVPVLRDLLRGYGLPVK
ncbi:HAD family hydrolase [Kribbella deserti]|uniref:HAD family hydrolase n=1 Tax=Kribbella deserti TaxID=1926257 RepID=A0ABV6QUZ0_9ACTN